MDAQRPHKPGRTRWLVVLAIVAVTAGVAGYAYFKTPAPAPAVPLPPLAAEATSEQVHRFCGACHAYPPPETLPRSAWRKEVKRGYDFLRDSALALDYPPLESVVRYYENRADEQLALPRPAGAATAWPVHFRPRGSRIADLPPYPAVTHLNLVHLTDDRRLDLLVCDTRLDQVFLLKPYQDSDVWHPLGPALMPCHTEVADLDGDGHQDILVACLGEFFATDDLVGSVVWLRGAGAGRFTPVTLLDGVGRVADVRAADFNGDGKSDLVVAVFGWRRTGEVLYLENQTTDWARPAFVPHRIDARHGASHVPVADLNGDGRPDFVALFSQEHETVVAFLNDGTGRFTPQTVYAGPHPAYGCSSIQLADLDGDRDLDVVLTNGDVLDEPYLLKPYHGVQWLENCGTYPFTHHPLAAMPGASCAAAGDLDGDGDADVVAVSFLPRAEFPQRDELGLDAVVLLEQTERGRFTRHTLASRSCDHFACAVGDWDADGKLDLATGGYSWKRTQAIDQAVTLWQNLGTNRPAGR
jgi:hypothetical protein